MFKGYNMKIKLIDYKELINDLKSGFDEIKAYKSNKTELTDGIDFLSELKSEN